MRYPEVDTRDNACGVQPRSLPGGDVGYTLRYRLHASSVEITAAVDNSAPPGAHLILPVVARAIDGVQQLSVSTIRITKPAGQLATRTSGPAFGTIPAMRSFNLVPGFECVPLVVPLQPGEEVTLRTEAQTTA